MASLQVDHASDVITEAEVTSKEPSPAAAAPENAKPLDVEDEEDLEDLTEPTYEEKVGNSDDEDAEYSPFMEREEEGEEAAPPLSYGGGPATFDDFNEDDDEDDIV
ncbi:uncharacterized protein LOC125216132 isoform X2 [Salvia hispanica]|uniref:uncharacterized protein LOC125216132 isoform X2 n=1 Tax=Salvia hispanica TaxID=49212 RepID=UPI0020098809|nr:uncharacterized protein LOC125216132 isoform X2 [Salvia hispanica]